MAAHPHRRTTAGALTLTLLLLAAAGCSGGAGGAVVPPASTSEPAAAESDGPRTAPDFTLSNLDGDTVALADSAGRVRLIDFWATWCAPCREEIPMLKELDREYGDDGLTILAISDETADVIRRFVDEHQIPYQNLVGTEELSESYSVLGLPTAYLIDRDGRIVKSFFGPKPRKVLEARIRELLDLPPQA